MQEAGNKLFTDTRLSIRLRADGFSFFTPIGRKDFSCKACELAATLDETIGKQLSGTAFTTVRLLVDAPSTRVPLDEFRSEEVTALYNLTFANALPEGSEVRYQVIPALELVELFPVDTSALAVVKRHYPHVAVLGFYGQLLDEAFAAECLRPQDVRRLYVSVSGSQLFLFAFKERRLEMANTFDTKEKENRLFFALSVWKALGLSQQTDECIVYGKDAELVEKLKKYIYKVSCV